MILSRLRSAIGVQGPYDRTISDLAEPDSLAGWVALHARLRPGAPALIDGAGVLSYGQLDNAVRERAAALREAAAGRAWLIAIEAEPRIRFVVDCLAGYAAGHVVLISTSQALTGELRTRFRADLELHRQEGQRPHCTEGEPGSTSQIGNLHPELALLLSTSGSTGSPKLVRLSHRNLVANAASIARYLELGPSDRSITSLPLHYSYGLSVLHSHLVAGAAVVLSPAAVVDPCFWRQVDDHRVSTLAGVPHTFELLQRIGFDTRSTPHLRRVTCAGGRLDPTEVTRWASAGKRAGWRFYVMYGQTEATARISYLPPEDALRFPSCIGRAIPGGEIELRAHPAASQAALQQGGAASDEPGEPGEPVEPDEPGDRCEAGELVYRGPNVMMGYATCRADLSRGAELTELRTGDLARRVPGTGYFELVGRTGRFVKPMSQRVDLDRLERLLAQHGFEVACAGDDRAVAVALSVPGVVGADLAGAERACRATVVELTGLPRGCVRMATCAELPRRDNGKLDYTAVESLVRRRLESSGEVLSTTSGAPRGEVGEPTGEPTVTEATPGEAAPEQVAPEVAELYASILGLQRVAASDSFVSLGGDSLSYVELSLVLERHLGTLPLGWHRRSVHELQQLASNAQIPRHRTPSGQSPRGHPDRFRRRRRGRSRRAAGRASLATLDTTVALRALAIAAVVATHMKLVRLPGGAHTLLAVAGYNFARFTLEGQGAFDVLARGARTAARVALPTSLWIALNMAIAGGYSFGAMLLVNDYTGSSWRTGGRWQYWFFEAFVKLVLAASLLVSVPLLRRWERRQPYRFALALLVVLLVLRYELISWGDPYNYLFRVHTVAWFFALGWLAERSATTRQKLLSSLLSATVVPGFFGQTQREWCIVAALVALVWLPGLRLPRPLIRPLGALAAASMWIFLVHWQLWPWLDTRLGLSTTYVIVLLSGVMLSRGVTRATRSMPWRGLSDPSLRQQLATTRTRWAAATRQTTPHLTPRASEP